ncbi:DUF1186 domain-containing protein [Ghiorsea bivora]|uniref:DUF1186 domain-containing protein n=1 Tax=Ghiorsea bivora TaxID=1485545 RepID=UPI0005708BCF|nr:DUF1186 domain-containing protein [Ghiorsea bivora]
MSSEQNVKIEKLFNALMSVDAPPSQEDFEKMVANQRELTPYLLHEMDAFIQDPLSIEAKGRSYIRHILSIFLLAYFREKAAFSKLIRLVSLENKLILTLTGEVLTEALGRLLASMYHGDIKSIQSVVENQKLNPWIRAGALDSLMVLWKEDVISRAEVMQYLGELLTNKLERNPSYVWDAVALIAYDLHPKELERQLTQAIEDKLIEPVVLSHLSLADCLAQPFQDALKLKDNVVDGFMKSPFEELSWWLYPDRKLLQKGKDYEALDVPIVDKDVIPGERVSPMGWRSATVVRGTKKLGRNEPCLCGSGKKYKKCCLNQ